MPSANRRKAIPIYSTIGDVDAILVYPYIFNLSGEWIGWITADRDIFSVHGHYVGWLSSDPRILRKRSSGHIVSRRMPPSAPQRITPPASFPLAPMLPELPFGVIDVLADAPDLLPCLDYGDLRDDMD
jgi:hypothetical protein